MHMPSLNHNNQCLCTDVTCYQYLGTLPFVWSTPCTVHTEMMPHKSWTRHTSPHLSTTYTQRRYSSHRTCAYNTVHHTPSCNAPHRQPPITHPSLGHLRIQSSKKTYQLKKIYNFYSAYFLKATAFKRVRAGVTEKILDPSLLRYLFFFQPPPSLIIYFCFGLSTPPSLHNYAFSPSFLTFENFLSHPPVPF